MVGTSIYVGPQLDICMGYLSGDFVLGNMVTLYICWVKIHKYYTYMFGRRAYMLGAICWWSYMLGYYICWVTWPNIYPTYIWVNTYVVYICWVTWGFVDETPFPEHCFRYNPVIITFLPRVIPFFVLSHHQILNFWSLFIFSDTRITPNNFEEPLQVIMASWLGLYRPRERVLIVNVHVEDS